MATRGSVSDADRRWLRALGTLNEYQVRLFVAERALSLERGGISRLARLTGMSRTTIAKWGRRAARPPLAHRRPDSPEWRGAPAGRRRGSQPAAAAHPDLGGDHGRGSHERAEVDEQVDPHDRGGTDATGASGECGHGRTVAGDPGLLAAGQYQDARGPAASRPRCPVPLYQRPRQDVPAQRRSRGLRRHQEEGARRAVPQHRPDLAAAWAAHRSPHP
jgi:hypothetical protein